MYNILFLLLLLPWFLLYVYLVLLLSFLLSDMCSFIHVSLAFLLQIDASAMTTRVQQLRDPNGTVRMTWLSSRMCDDSSARHLLRSSRVRQVNFPQRYLPSVHLSVQRLLLCHFLAADQLATTISFIVRNHMI